ncbi:isochorismatase family protein [Embleya scabrispora]|uniref:isochorismatase family protein n=1 Tax=Embleya scabrispora TaxID=159449 RepID=UPI00036B1529|nr:isochorismatase family protein [Embleya scabrispora]MYS82668.1 isochorismatase family protein [Streptomyces sp. SID5474]
MTANIEPVSALLVVDVQMAFVTGAGAVPAAERVVERAATLIARARANGALVVHLQNDGPVGADDEIGTPGWKLRLPVAAGPREVVVRKTEDDGFDGTPLADLLTRAGVTGVAVCGVMSEMCVGATAREALARGYRVVLPHDAHATYDIPAAPGISEAVPAPMVSRVAEWALGDEVEIVAHVEEVTFTDAGIADRSAEDPRNPA